MKVKEGDVLVCHCEDCHIELTVTKSCSTETCGVECELDAKCCGEPMDLKAA
jgi:hypothetical protein